MKKNIKKVKKLSILKNFFNTKIKYPIKVMSIKVFLFFNYRLKLKPNAFATIMNGVGVGLVANIIFVTYADSDIDFLRLIVMGLFAILLLILSSIEKD